MFLNKVPFYSGLVILTFCAIRIVKSQTTQEASYQCMKDSNNRLTAKFRIRPNNDTIYQIVGHTAVEADPSNSSPVSSCTTVLTEGQEIYQVNVTIDLDTDTTISPDCGVHVVNPRYTYKLRFRTQAAVGIRSDTDVYYDFICDSRSSFLETHRVIIIVTGGSQDIQLQPYKPGLSLSLIDHQSGTPLYGETELGREIYYQIEFQRCHENKLDLHYDACGNEFMIGLHSFGSTGSSEHILYIMNPSTVSTNVYIDNMGSALPCSPVMIGPNSFGTCALDSSFEVSMTSNLGIRLLSPHQCVYVQNQYSDSQQFYVYPIFPVDVTGALYQTVYDDGPADIIVLSSSNTTFLSGDTENTAVETVLNSYQTTYMSMTPSNSHQSFVLFSNNADKFSVFIKRSLSSGFTVEQLPTETVAGKSTVVPNIDSVTTTCLAHFDNTQITFNSVISSLSRGSTVQLSDPKLKVIESNYPISCRLNDDLGHTSVALMPLAQWSNAYRFVVDKTKATYVIMVSITSTERNSLGLEVGGNAVSLSSISWSQVAGTNPEIMAANLILDLSATTGKVLVVLSHPTTNFQALLQSTHSVSSKISLSNIPGFNLAVINSQSCSPTLGSVGDLVDNDCDGLVDEDLHAGTDVKGINQGKACFDKIKVLNCDVSPDLTFGNLTRPIITEGCLAGSVGDPFRPTTSFEYDSAKSAGSTSVYATGKTKLVGFEYYDELYVRCDVKFCIVSDPSCHLSTCSSRKKREVTEDITDELVTIDDFQSKASTQATCFRLSVYIAVITLLSVVTALLLAVAIGILVRLQNLTSSRSKHFSVSMTNLGGSYRS